MEESEKKDDFKLQSPRLRPVNGRIVLNIMRDDRYTKAKGVDILIPKDLAIEKNMDNRATENPDAGNRYFVVAMAPEVNEQLRMNKVNLIPEYVKNEKQIAEFSEEDELQLGDEITLSPNWEPIKFGEEQTIFAIIHWQDILGVNQNILFSNPLPEQKEPIK
jgi:hypothetical protein